MVAAWRAYGTGLSTKMSDTTNQELTTVHLLKIRGLSNSVKHSQKHGDKPVRPLLRSILLGILLFPFLLPLYPQEKGTAAKEENLYSKALFASIAEMEKSYSHMDDSDSGTRIRTDYHHMFVEQDLGLTNDLAEQFGEYRVEYLDTQNQIASLDYSRFCWRKKKRCSRRLMNTGF